MINKKIGFIGSGNMAYSLIGGLNSTGVTGQNIWVSDPNTEKMTPIASQFGVNITNSNVDLVQSVDIVILAVKPQQLAHVCTEIAPVVTKAKPLVISIAAGVLSKDIESWLNPVQSDLALVRCMPNTPALVQSGATALFANKQVSDEQKTLAESILRAAGLTLWLDDESDMDAVTALSGSGPAYFFLVIDAMEKAGVQLGLDEKTAHLLAIQTAFGASKMALESNDSPETLRMKVTSPGGTTEKAIGILQDGQLESLFAKALEGAKNRSIELAQILGNDSVNN
ncbi:MAG: pyrroline-5-carboxylate reductase [gamma proteobacterium symbiont of Bathyaustriella thionipta]|nr:pyrroline-5-carboxylate reductase [gamma proteobacterium symbiont of Bathyaustriella thionipta]MCU7951033.1 pyrroline-5-carboxylate reductase [gamma proteobacterium symbiont of Bathyaustriella thionipta]MCU7953513.1 pyrroline-5-carboxylate reductase [gamma proteobacterium symbiont of Bathyaustriella thionipta]MCU7957539.1 pyrroline-5-carboxylate reductase [gamma proteobacterium symbiont of Bathyaustriella thionipta]MCU7969010.1 pyrroline-5-carboxylate reductase [gamma proteobacterium symbion